MKSCLSARKLQFLASGLIRRQVRERGGTEPRQTILYRDPLALSYFLRALDAAELFELFAEPERFFPPEDLTVRPLRPSL